MARKKNTSLKLEEFEQSNGKIEKTTDDLRTLEAIFCENKTNPFGTRDSVIFEENLARMGPADLQALAEKIGVNKFLSMPDIKDQLRHAFAIHKETSMGEMKLPDRKVTGDFDLSNPAHVSLMKSLGMTVY